MALRRGVVFVVLCLLFARFPFAQITVGVVDAHSGEILAFTKPLTATKVLKRPKVPQQDDRQVAKKTSAAVLMSSKL